MNSNSLGLPRLCLLLSLLILSIQSPTSYAAATELTEEQKLMLMQMLFPIYKLVIEKDESLHRFYPEARDAMAGCASHETVNDLLGKKEFFSSSEQVMKKTITKPYISKMINDCIVVAVAKQMEIKENMAATPSYEVSDIFLDYSILSGKSVRVKGHLINSGDISLLTDKRGSSAFLFLNTAELSREERKVILKDCNPGCTVWLEGIVGDIDLQKGIKVTKLEKVGS